MYVDIDFTRKSLKIRSRHSKDRQYNGQQKKRQQQKTLTMIYKTLHRKVNLSKMNPTKIR